MRGRGPAGGEWAPAPPPLALLELLSAAGAAAPELFPADLGTAIAVPTGMSADALGSTVTRVAQDHRRVVPGALFVARKGGSFDGHAYLAEAAARGAVMAVGEAPPGALTRPLPLPYLPVRDARRALPYLAAAFEGWPSHRLRVHGVTGTDGKTTTANILHWLLSGDHLAGLLSTAGSKLGQTPLPAGEGHFTTPEATEVQAFLGGCARRGAAHAVLESSSHGFWLHRLDAVEYATGIVTNLTPEHLNHHGSLAAYMAAKATLVRRAQRSVLNLDDTHYGYFRAAARDAITFGAGAGADVRIGRAASAGGATAFDLAVFGEPYPALLPLPGAFNAWNAAAAVTVAVLEGVPPAAAVERLATFPGVPGRMQLVQAEPFTVIVDFAHTPAALAKALAAVRTPRGRTIVVVGSAGDRDVEKRPGLGREAVLGADLAVLTEEDSRAEDPLKILGEMAAGAMGAGAREGDRYLLEPDRRAAIRLALSRAQAGDVVLLAGKGHERTLERAHETIDWDEAAEARAALALLGHRTGLGRTGHR